MAVCIQRCRAVQKKSTPCRKPTNSGGSPSGLSAPPTLATRIMKKMKTCVLCFRALLARISGLIRIMAAPVVPTMLAIPVPSASIAVFVHGVPRMVPVTRMPPATV